MSEKGEASGCNINGGVGKNAGNKLNGGEWEKSGGNTESSAVSNADGNAGSNIGSNAEKGGDNELKLRLYKIVSIVASAVAIIAFAFLIIGTPARNEIENAKKGAVRILLSDIPAGHVESIYTEKGVKGYIVLPDGSEVWLNSDTRLSFPTKFIGNTREVNLEGEGYFKVQKDSLKPMIVNTHKGLSVKVLGTEFNIKAYDNDEMAEATLFSGKISLVYTSSKTEKVVKEIRPNTKALFSAEKLTVVSPQTIEDEVAWTKGKLIFNATKMNEVIKMLERWHGVEFVVKEPKILDYPITATFNNESIVQIMDMIKYCSLIDYKIVNNHVELFGR